MKLRSSKPLLTILAPPSTRPWPRSGYTAAGGNEMSERPCRICRIGPLAAPLVLCTLLLAWSGLSRAQEPGGLPPLEGGPTPSTMAVQAGYGLLGEDYFINLAVGAELNLDPVMLGLQLPLRIRVVDNAPESKEWYREEDWDEVSDWTRILRYIQYGKPADPVYVRLGELAASTIGHGTILNRYYNNLDADHYYTGLATNLNMDVWGSQFLVNNIMGWNLVGMRGYVKPLAMALPDLHPVPKSLRTGVSFISDFRAPWSIALDEQGRPAFDGENNLKYEERSAWFLGFDLAIDVFSSKIAVITPYTDLNFFRDVGVGWHLGILTALKALSSEFTIKLEYRAVGAGYSPAYFNSLYELEKVSFLPLANFEPSPKLKYFSEADLETQHGMYGELYVNILGKMGIGGAYEDYQGPNNSSLMLRAELPKIIGIQLAAYYTRRNFDGLDDVFSLDRAMAVAQATVDLTSPFMLFAAYNIRWRLDTEPTSVTQGDYLSESSFEVGVGAAFTF